ncbi:MAG TPA: alpha/beta fold hydrolase [Sphingobacteriaceae bacterium]
MKRLILILGILFLNPDLRAQAIDTVRFNSGKSALTGILVRPVAAGPGKKIPVVIVLHYAGGGLHSNPLYQVLAKDLNSIGISAFLYDRRGEGLSNNGKVDPDYFDLADDARSAIEKLKTLSNIDTSRIGLYGVSQGCWIAAITNTLVADIKFQILVSPSTIAPSPQMDYAAWVNLKQKGFQPHSIDSALKLRNVIDDFYRGKISREYAAEQRRLAEKEEWFPEAYIFDLDETPETGTWRQNMDFDPLIFFKRSAQPKLVFYGEYDKWVPIERGIDDWNKLALDDLTIKRIANTGHLMIINEKHEPVTPVFSDDYRNALKEWARSIVH